MAGPGTGVYVGSMGADFRLRCDGLGTLDQYTASGTMDAFLANRVSYYFDARGCSTEVGTACSSGLAAAVQAVWALAAGHVDVAIAGGVSVICHGFDQEALLRAGLLSPTGRSRPFSEGADGYVRGEGVAVVVLKRLADAQRDGDPIRAVIRGASQTHDGRSGGQFSPSPQTQAEMIRQTARRAGIAPTDLGYVEAHATGTKLGDEAEATGLVQALGGAARAGGPEGRLWVGAIKATIGHTEAAAGLFGLVKAILVLENDSIPAISGLVAPSASVAGLGSLLGLPTAPVPWPRAAGQPRAAGVSSFGLGGANAHVVLTDPPVPAAAGTRPGGRGTRLLPLSAGTATALSALAASLREWLREHPEADIPAVAATLQAGRAALPCRTVLASDGTTADAAGDGVTGAFLAGEDADWAALWDGERPRRVGGLPLYPFEAQSHWPRAERPPAPLLPRPPLPRRQPATATPATQGPATLLRPASPGLTGLVRLAPLAPAPDLPPTAPTLSPATSPAPATPLPPATPPAPAALPAPAAAPLLPGAAPEAAELARVIATLAAQVLYLPSEQVTLDGDLVAAGLDSVVAVEFTQLVAGKTGLDVRTEQLYATRTSRALAAELARAPGGADAGTSPGSPVPALGDGGGQPDVARLTRQLRKLAGECLYLLEDEVDTGAELSALGLDSVLAVEFLAKLNAEQGTALTLTQMYEGRTLSGLAAVLALGGGDAR